MSSLTSYLSVDGARAWSEPPSRLHVLRLRVRVYLRRAQLDRMLAASSTPDESFELALRARQLGRERHRRRLAASLEEVVRIAQEGGPTRTARPPLARRDVRASSAALLQLAQVLRHERVNVKGVVLAERLLTDGAGPLYVYGHDDQLWHAAREATAALDGYPHQAVRL